MFARQPRFHRVAFLMALLVTTTMLGAVESLATHATADVQVAQAVGTPSCPVRG